MNPLSLQSLANLLQARTVHPIDTSSSLICTGISTDSRTLRRGECFVALKGDRFDGHDHVEQAFARGACCALVDTSFNIKDRTGSPLVQVPNTTTALGTLARHFRQEADFRVIAITGSVGKTSTRHIIAHVLSDQFRVHQSPRNFNNHIGLPLSLLSAQPHDEMVVVELGSSAPGEISYLTHIAQPDIAVVTNVSPAHLEGLGDIASILQEKMSIAEGLRSGGRLFVNGDNSAIRDHCRKHALAATTFGISPAAQIRADRVELGAGHSTFLVQDRAIRLPLPGPGNIANALAAWAVCSSVGVEWESFAAAVKTLGPPPMRADVLSLGSLTIINDCYNASPASMENALSILGAHRVGNTGRRVCILGEMAELGADSQSLHEVLGQRIAEAEVDLLIAIGPLVKFTAQSASSLHAKELQIAWFDDTISACQSLTSLIQDHDVVLVKGSRSVGLEKAVETLKEMVGSA
ncbi:MAG: UDP-N-acetylmuramoyl-tripeptide--D-alanyl-D-alanine ligase [Planctomycetes bacterium]|nr:UDP-N-acetylmuramoyl-tripeptide--D-alanyl-D-alanine ligase [Planctomycetota bacterium]